MTGAVFAAVFTHAAAQQGDSGAVTAAWVTAAAALLAILGGLAVFTGRLLYRIWARLMGFLDFLDDIRGEPARPGVAARPGVMERLQAVEASMAEVRAELQPNGGSSLRDAVNALAQNLTAHRTATRDELP